MAILISGILIALVIAVKDNTPKYSFVSNSHLGGMGYLKLNTETGYVCYGSTDKAQMKNIQNRKSKDWIVCKD